jgi:Na+/H+-dicarboxylate symporter
MKEGTRVLVGLGAGLGCGIAIAASHNPRLADVATIIAPIGVLWINAIRMTVIPLVIALLVTGVASVSDVRTIGRIGRRTLLTFLALLLGVAVVAIPLAALVFSWWPASSGTPLAMPAGAAEAAGLIASSGPPPTFIGWLETLIPVNPIAAAAQGAMLPLIVFTLILALAIAQLGGDAHRTLLGFFRALSDAMLVMVRWVVALAPIGIFALMLPLAAQGGAGVAGALGFYVVAYSLITVVMILLLYPAVAIAARVSITRFGRAALPAQLIAFSSSSSLASLPALVEGAEGELAIPDRVTGFVLPLAVSIFKIAAPVSWPIGTLFVAHFYGIPLHTRDLVTVGLAGVFLAMAAPGVPRGAFLMLAPLFSAIGLPVAGIGILIAVDAIPDLFATVLNATGDIVATTIVARYEANPAGAPSPAASHSAPS